MAFRRAHAIAAGIALAATAATRAARAKRRSEETVPVYFTIEEKGQFNALLDRLADQQAGRPDDEPRWLPGIRDLGNSGEEQYALTELAEWITRRDVTLTQHEFDFLTALAAAHSAQAEISALRDRVR